MDKSNIRTSLFDYSALSIDAVPTALSQYRDYDALLVTNVASKCGLTKDQYTGLVQLRNNLTSKGKFEILAFPCSQFANQEPGTADEIKNFVRQFHVEFPLFEKINVNGPQTHPIYCFLKYNTPELRDVSKTDVVTLKPIGWNFGKFLIDGEGRVVKYWGPKVNPLECEDDILNTIQGRLRGAETRSPPDTATIRHDDDTSKSDGQACMKNSPN